MQAGHRLRCYPTDAQAKILLQWIGCQRFIYNAKVGEDRYFRAFARKSLALAGQFAPIDQQYSHFKTDLTPWLRDVPSQVLRNGAVLWKQAYSRFFQKLGGRPVIHGKQGQQSAWLTSELFAFEAITDPVTGTTLEWNLHLGTARFPVGALAFTAHRKDSKDRKLEFDRPPASLHISVNAGRWHVSFNSDDGAPEPSEQDTIEWLMQFTEGELSAVTVGLDRGVAIPVASSDGRQFDFSATQVARLAAQERHKKRWQRRQARRTKGSRNWVKARRKVARYQRYGADVRRDVAHKTNHALVSDDRIKLLVFEALRVKDMSLRPKPKSDEHGRWAPNGASAKAGLNKAILASTWGQTLLYCSYKARRAGKLTIAVPAQYSSQECSACGHTHPDNRLSQAVFVCQSCGHHDHADHNAAKVIARRGVRLLLSGTLVQRQKKRCRITKHKVGAGCSEPAAAMQPTPGETAVSRPGGNTRRSGR